MFITITQSIKMSTTALLANKTRSFLTMLGIIIGVGAVVVIMAVGAGAQSLIVNQVKTLGTNVIGILPGKSEEKGPPASAMGIVITTLTDKDAEAVAKLPYVEGVVAYSKGVANASWRSNSYFTNLNGCTIGYLTVEGGEVAEGRFFSKEEEKNLARVAVLGWTVKKELFGDSEAVGAKIKIKNKIFKVIGVMKERGTVAFQDYDDQILLPLRTMQKLILGVNHVGLIRIKIKDESFVAQAEKEIASIIRQRHNIEDSSGDNDDFTVRSAAEALDIIISITDSLRYFLAAIAALSLLVGGIGIMNIMLVSVLERTREIGLRKALGATTRAIMEQFLFEAVTVTFIGGVIGIVGGVIVSFLAAVIIRYLGYNWEFSISSQAILVAVFVSTVIGLIFGLYPARKAARLEPVEALRYE